MTPQEIESLIAQMLTQLLGRWLSPAIIQDVVQAVFDFVVSHLKPMASMSTAQLASSMPKAVPFWLIPLIVQAAQFLLQWITTHNNPPAPTPTPVTP